jgi:hypothetical protein
MAPGLAHGDQDCRVTAKTQQQYHIPCRGIHPLFLHAFIEIVRSTLVSDYCLACHSSRRILQKAHTIKKNAREAQSLLEQNRERGTDGATLHDDYSVLFDRLTTDVAILEEHRDELNKKMRIDRLNVLRYWFAIAITVVIGVLGIILAT